MGLEITVGKSVSGCLANLPPEIGRQVGVLCDRFEAVWLAHSRPRIEDYLREIPEGIGRSSLLKMLVILEVFYRLDSREMPKPEEYASRFPELDSVWLAQNVRPHDADDNHTLSRANSGEAPASNEGP